MIKGDFFSKGGKFEAVKLNIGEVFENLEELSTISRFLTGYADFVLAGDDLEFGIVIERTEYHYEFSMWVYPQYEIRKYKDHFKMRVVFYYFIYQFFKSHLSILFLRTFLPRTYNQFNRRSFDH